MTREEASNVLKSILTEATEAENSVSYVTSNEAEALDIAIKALEVKEEEDCISRAKAIERIENLRDINEYYHPSSKNNYLICCDSAIDDLRQVPSVHPKYGAEDYIPKHKIYAAIKEIKEEKAITSAEIIENDRQDLVNYKTALNYCLEILEQHIKGNEGE